MISKEKFSFEVEELHTGAHSYLDAILQVCENHDIEVQTANKFITSALKKKIETEAIRLRLIKTDGKKHDTPNVGWLEGE